MVVITVTNSCLGLSYIDTNRIYSSKCSSAFLICRKPIFSCSLRRNCIVKQNSRKQNCRSIRVLLKGESGITEKDFDFKPSFDEYLKALESVKSNRKIEQTPSSAKPKSKNDEVLTREADSANKNGSKDRVIREMKDETKSKVEDTKDGGRNRNNKYENKDMTVDRVPYNQTRSIHESKTNPKSEISRYGENRFEGKKAPYKRSTNEVNLKESFETTNSYVNKDTTVDRKSNNQARTIQQSPINRKSEMSGYERNSFIDKNVPYRRNTSKSNLNESFKRINDEISDDDDDEERVAFKTIDFDDIHDKPRITRVDMEDRIQKLAKCLNGADIEMPEWMFSKMMRSARIKFSDHSVLRIIQILSGYGNWRRVLQMIEWLDSRERYISYKLRYIYTAALDALGKARRPVEALNLFYSMQKQMATYPDAAAYHCIAVTLGQAGHMKELFDVIDFMRSPPKTRFKSGILERWDPRLEPDMIVYNAVLNACVHRKNWEGAFWVLQQLKEHGKQPSTATYGLVMEVMFASGKYNLVHDFFQKMQKSSIPSALTYKVLVNTLWKEGKIDEAITAVKDMEARGIIGSASLYYDLARCLCSSGRSREALMQMEKICKVANKPLVVTYTGLIQACLDSGNIKDGAYIFKHMQNHCSPNLVSCNIMLKGYLDQDMFEEALEFFDKLVNTANQIKSTSDYRDKVIPDIYTFNLVLDACASKEKWNDVERVYETMLHRGFHFNSKRHLRLILEASRAGKVNLLETTWQHLITWDQTAPPPLIKEILKTKLEGGDYAGTIDCVTRYHSSESNILSFKFWLNFFKENQNCFERETLVRLVHEVSLLISKTDTSSTIPYDNLVSSCNKILNTRFDLIDTVS